MQWWSPRDISCLGSIYSVETGFSMSRSRLSLKKKSRLHHWLNDNENLAVCLFLMLVQRSKTFAVRLRRVIYSQVYICRPLRFSITRGLLRNQRRLYVIHRDSSTKRVYDGEAVPESCDRRHWQVSRWNRRRDITSFWWCYHQILRWTFVRMRNP